MTSEKFSISLPEALAKRIEEYAEADGVSRSFIIQEATAQYVSKRRKAKADEEFRASVDRAIAGFDRMAKMWGDDPRSSLDYLREIRGEPYEGDPSDKPTELETAGRHDVTLDELMPDE